ncbi:DUF6320 domain-containing protein [Christensenellaceae bacterium OttesenSCG-928-M15]|nr:DUF6320 domain-containing protein [Christensenellaceae bacterium OttesenSCG-928-M15]
MKVKITYPQVEKKKMWRQDMIEWAKWLFLFAAIACIAVNAATGGPAWCLIGIWSFGMIWSFLISPELVEQNRISVWIGLITSASILLLIIDALFRAGWSAMVVPLVHFGGLAVAGILFFTDLERQKQNMLPMLLLIAAGLMSFAGGLLLGRRNWALIAMGAFAFALLIACIAVLRNGFAREIKKRFHIR